MEFTTGTLVGLASGIITLVVLPLIAYIQRRKDKEHDRLSTRVDELENKETLQDVQITELKGEVKTVALVYAEIREIRGKMDTLVTQSEFRYWAELLAGRRDDKK